MMQRTFFEFKMQHPRVYPLANLADNGTGVHGSSAAVGAVLHMDTCATMAKACSGEGKGRRVVTPRIFSFVPF